MKILCTFSGKFGDILWSLPTVREISRQHGTEVAFACMPPYESLLPLLREQPYIAEAFVIKNWECTGSPNGDQPWQAPDVPGYDKVYNLTYRSHPGINSPVVPLIDLVAGQQSVRLSEPVVPFLSLKRPAFDLNQGPIVPYAFNPMYQAQKEQFLAALRDRVNNVTMLDVGAVDWLYAADIIQKCGVYVGCRSACWVMAVGLGVQTITYEPEADRHAAGRFGQVFSCPYGREKALQLGLAPSVAADAAGALIEEELKRRN